jgi:hypothetical protein
MIYSWWFEKPNTASLNENGKGGRGRDKEGKRKGKGRRGLVSQKAA